MNLVQPIRDKEDIESTKRILLKSGTRDHLLFVVGINTGLRVSDILKLKVSDIRDTTHIKIKEKKTGKDKWAFVNDSLRRHSDPYIIGMEDDDYLFPSRKGINSPISRSQAYRILNGAARAAGISYEIGTHTLRKTFGYHHYKQYKDVALLQNLFNHSSPGVTLRYIGVTQDNMDETVRNFGL